MSHRKLSKKQLKRREKAMKGELDYHKFWDEHGDEAIAAVEELADTINKLHEITRCCGLDYIVWQLVQKINIGGHGKVGALQTTIARLTQQVMPRAPQINVLDPATFAALAKKKQEEAVKLAKESKRKKTLYVA